MNAKRGKGDLLDAFLKTAPRPETVSSPAVAVEQARGLGHAPRLDPSHTFAAVATRSLRLDVGIHYDVPERDYHGDPCVEPSLSASFGSKMLDTTPRRAWATHPRLNPGAEPFAPTATMDEGSVLHRLILGVGPEYTLVDARDWKTNDAKNARLVARKAGVVPILAGKFEELEAIAAQARRCLEQSEKDCQVLSDEYASEVTCIARMPTGALVRIRPDRLHRTDSSAPVYDFKFTDKLDLPSEWDRGIFYQNWDMRAALYQRVLAELRDGEEPPYRYIIVEKIAPVDVVVFELTESFYDIGQAKAGAVIDAWERCLSTGYWPGHPRRVFHIQEPGWAKRQVQEILYHLSGVLPGGRFTAPPAPVDKTTLRDFALADGGPGTLPRPLPAADDYVPPAGDYVPSPLDD